MAATTVEGSDTPAAAAEKNEKPVIVRVKRKASQSPLEAFWLEINERPVKRPLLDFARLSINPSSSSKVVELKTKKVLVQHLETVTSSEFAFNVLQSVVASEASSSKAAEFKAKSEERKHTFKAGNKQDKLLVKAKEKQQVLSKNARFEQIWRSRKGKKEAGREKPLRDMCNLYDVVRVDNEEAKNAAQEDEDLEAQRLMSSFLPLLREFIPSAAEEIETDISNDSCKQVTEDEYVYDLYAVRGDDASVMETDSSNPFPLVQVDDEDEYYDGPEASEYESDDSNAEDNPLNDYPDEEESDEDEDEETKSENADDESEHESSSTSDKSSENDEDEDFRHYRGSRAVDRSYEDDTYDLDDGEMYVYDDGDDDKDDGSYM